MRGKIAGGVATLAFYVLISPAFGSQYGFVYSGGTYTSLGGPPGNTYTQALGINNAGQIVGSYLAGGSGSLIGYLFSGGTYTTFTGPSGSVLTSPTDINDAGQIVGSY